MRKITYAQIKEAMEYPRTIREVANLLGCSEKLIRTRMKEMALKPWGTPFAQGYTVRCKDGHRVDSLGEAQIDDWLFEQGIPHEVHKKLQGLPCIVDFWLSTYNVGIEYVGVEGIPTYDYRIEVKKAIYDLWEISVIWLYPEMSREELQNQLKDVWNHE